jgi:hypothetical protein
MRGRFPARGPAVPIAHLHTVPSRGLGSYPRRGQPEGPRVPRAHWLRRSPPASPTGANPRPVPRGPERARGSSSTHRRRPGRRHHHHRASDQHTVTHRDCDTPTRAPRARRHHPPRVRRPGAGPKSGVSLAGSRRVGARAAPTEARAKTPEIYQPLPSGGGRGSERSCLRRACPLRLAPVSLPNSHGHGATVVRTATNRRDF